MAFGRGSASRVVTAVARRRAGTALANMWVMNITRRTRPRDVSFAKSASLISDLVPTIADEVTLVTRMELKVLPTAEDGDVFADTLETMIDYDPSR